MGDDFFNPLSTQDMAEQVADLYLKAAMEWHRLQALQIANGDGDEDPVPGMQPLRGDDGMTVLIEDGRPIFPKYGERSASYRDTMQRLRTSYDSIWPAIEQILEDRKQA